MNAANEKTKRIKRFPRETKSGWSLSKLTKKGHELVKEDRVLSARTLTGRIDLGQVFIAMKDHPDLAHGQWTPYFEKHYGKYGEYGFTIRTAQNYMNLAKGKTKTVRFCIATDTHSVSMGKATSGATEKTEAAKAMEWENPRPYRIPPFDIAERLHCELDALWTSTVWQSPRVREAAAKKIVTVLFGIVRAAAEAEAALSTAVKDAA